MDVSEAKRVQPLEDENRRLKALLADPFLDNAALKDLVAKMFRRPGLGTRRLSCHRTSRTARASRQEASRRRQIIGLCVVRQI
jgi:hypothetical protein